MAPHQKRIKLSSCIICGGLADHVKENEILTKAVVRQLIPGCERNRFVGVSPFEFCVQCTEVLEELHKLHIGMEFILQNMKQKEMEIKVKILKGDCKFYPKEIKSFRWTATREFRPKVQLTRSSGTILAKIDKDGSIPRSGANIFYNELPMCSTNEDLYFESVNLKSEITTPTIEEFPSEETMVSQFVADEGPFVELTTSELFATQKNNEENNLISDPLCDIQKCLPEGNVLEAHFTSDTNAYSQFNLSQLFKSSLTVRRAKTKFKRKKRTPEKESVVRQDNYLNESPFIVPLSLTHTESDKEPVNVCGQSGTKINNKGTRIVMNNSYTSSKPPFTYPQLAMLAIMTSEKPQLRMGEIINFILENFHYYRSHTDAKFCQRNVQYGLRTSKCFTKIPVFNGKIKSYLYGVNVCPESLSNRDVIYSKFDCPSVSNFMVFPERRTVFQKAVLNKVSEKCQNLIGEPSPVNRTQLDTNIDIKEELNESLIKVECDFLPTTNVDEIPNRTENGKRKAASLKPKNRKNKKASTNKTTKDWSALPHGDLKLYPKPLLTNEQLCILAIFNSKDVRAKFDDVHSFIIENFPYFRDTQPPYRTILKTVLIPFKYVPEKFSDVSIKLEDQEIEVEVSHFYTLNSSQISSASRHNLTSTLCSAKNLFSMAFPDRVVDFIKNMVTNSLVINHGTKL